MRMSKWLVSAAALATGAVMIARAVRRRRLLTLANSKAKASVSNTLNVSKLALTPVIVRQSSLTQRGWHKARVVLSAIRLAGVRPARIALLLAGSRGDYQGYAQLCKVLVQRRLKVEAWCLGEANAEFMRSLGIDARAADVPVGDELFKRDPSICKAMETGDEVMYMKAISALFAQHSAGIAASAINFHDAFQPDVIVYHPMMMGVAKDLHDVSGLPVVLGALFPRTPSKHLAPLYYARTGDDSPGRPDRTEEEVHAASCSWIADSAGRPTIGTSRPGIDGAGRRRGSRHPRRQRVQSWRQRQRASAAYATPSANARDVVATICPSSPPLPHRQKP